MKKVEHVVVGSGITKHVEERVTLESDADFQALLADARRNFDWDAYTSRDIAALKAALADAEGGTRRNWRPREDREWFWEMMLMHHEIASTHMAKGNISAAMCAAARYGSYRALHDMKFAHERNALRGEATLAAARKGGQERPRADALERQEAARAAYIAALPTGREPRADDRSAARRAAKRVSGLGDRQLRRVLADIK